jgi:hypothetical protein
LIVTDDGKIVAKDDPLPGVLGRNNTIGASQNNAALEVGKFVNCRLAAGVFHVELRKIVLIVESGKWERCFGVRKSPVSSDV